MPSMFDLSGAWDEMERLSEYEGEFRVKETVEVLIEAEVFLHHYAQGFKSKILGFKVLNYTRWQKVLANPTTNTLCRSN